MTEETYRRWDILLKVVALLGSALAIYGYFDKKETEFRRPFWDEQLKLYFEATDTAAKIANLPPAPAGAAPAGDERDTAIGRFWQLYYGSLRVVEDTTTSRAMEAFGTCLRDKCSQTTLKDLSLDLADACKKSVGETWSQKFKDYRAQVEDRNKPQAGGEKK
jgi:hypothetical protein